MTIDEARVRRAADRLAAAYNDMRRITLSAEEAPASPAEAMRVQAEVLRRLGAEVGGWKVGIRPDGLASAAPMYRHWIVPQERTYAIQDNGPTGIEVEIGVRLSRDLPPRPGKPYTRGEVLACIDRVYPGIEVVTSRLANQNEIPYPCLLADNVANGGYIIGAGLDRFEHLDLSKLRCVIRVDGRTIHDKVGGNPWSDPLVPIVACASAQMDHVGGFRAGQIVTTGSLCGLLWHKRGERIEAEIAGLGSVRLQL